MSALRIKIADGEKKACEPAPLVLTIGHSTRTLKEFISLLHAHGATCVVDVRTVPRSRHNPEFNKASLPSSLKKAGLGYFTCQDSVGCVVLGPIRLTWVGAMLPFEVMRITCKRRSLSRASKN
jgi:hypothetical protein